MAATIYLRLEQTTSPTKQALGSKKNQAFNHHSTTIAGRLHTPTGWARPHPARAWMDTSKHSYGKQRWQCSGERKSQAKHTRQTKTTDMDYETKNNTHMWESTQNISQAQYLGSSDGKLLEAFFIKNVFRSEVASVQTFGRNQFVVMLPVEIHSL